MGCGDVRLIIKILGLLLLCQYINTNEQCIAEYAMQENGVLITCKFQQSIRNKGTFSLSYLRTDQAVPLDQIVLSCSWTKEDQEKPTCSGVSGYKLMDNAVISDTVTVRSDRAVTTPKLFTCKVSDPVGSECTVNVTDNYHTATSRNASASTSLPGTSTTPHVDETNITTDTAGNKELQENIGQYIGIAFAVVVMAIIIAIITVVIIFRRRLFKGCYLKQERTRGSLTKIGDTLTSRVKVDRPDEEETMLTEGEFTEQTLAHIEPEDDANDGDRRSQQDVVPQGSETNPHSTEEINHADLDFDPQSLSEVSQSRLLNSILFQNPPDPKALCEGYQLVCVKSLLSRDPSIINNFVWRDRTLLYWTSFNGYDDVVEYLLHKGAEVNKASRDGETALIAASERGHQLVVDLLLKWNADVNLCDENGFGPLYVAAKNGHAGCVISLLSHHALCNIKTKKKEDTPLIAAASSGSEEVVRALLKHGAIVNASDKSGETPIYIAAQGGYHNIVELLFKNGSLLNKADNDGRTPLYIAAFKGFESVVKNLLSGDEIEINTTDNNGATPLFVAAQQGCTAVVELLLSAAGINVDQKNFNDVTPLFMAAQGGHTNIVKLLLQHHADANSPNHKLVTPIMVASTNGHEDTVRALLKNGADVNLKDKSGKTALDWAREKKHTEIENLLLNRV